MNLFKRMAAAVIALFVMAAAFAGCHPASEVAMTVGGYDVTSSMYMCFLIQADSEARNTVDEANADNSDYDSDTVDYYKQTVEDTDFSAWVKNRAKELTVEYATYMKLFNDSGMTLSDDDQSEVDTYASYYWDTYGYSKMYEANGVSESTYKQYIAYNYVSKEYFVSIYGQDGTNPVDSDTVKQTIAENFAAVAQLKLSYTYTDSSTSSTVSYSDDEITAIKETAQEYADRIKAGESFSAIYNEANGTDDDGSSNDTYAEVFVSEAAQNYVSSSYYSFDHWDEVNSMAVGDTIVIDDDDNGYSLVLYKYENILDNDTYVDSFYDIALYILKQDEFEANIQSTSDSLEVTVNDYAVNRFKPKNIDYATSSSST